MRTKEEIRKERDKAQDLYDLLLLALPLKVVRNQPTDDTIAAIKKVEVRIQELDDELKRDY